MFSENITPVEQTWKRIFGNWWGLNFLIWMRREKCQAIKEKGKWLMFIRAFFAALLTWFLVFFTAFFLTP